MEKIQRYAKFVAAFVAAVAAGAFGIFDDGAIAGVVEWTVFITAVANAVNVVLTPELTAGAARAAKGLTAVAFALAGAVTPAVVAGGIDASEKFMLASVVLGALGALALPNARYRYAVKTQRGGPVRDVAS